MTTPRRPVDDFAEEIRAHLDLEAARLEAEGLAPADARLAARRAFGSIARAEERFYESGRRLWLDHLRQDMRSAVRSLARYPLAAAVAMVSLAGGIGETTATLTIRNVVFHNPPPLYAQPAQLSTIEAGTPARPLMPTGSLVPAPLYALWRDDAAVGAEMAGARMPRLVDVRAADRSTSLRVQAVAPSLFAVLGVHAALGATFAEFARASSAPAPAVLSDRVWRTLFDGRADAVGSPIWIDNAPYLVAGVMPPRFWFSDTQPLIWTAIDPRTLAAGDQLELIARRAPGMSPSAFAAALQPGLAAYTAGLPDAERQWRIRVSPVEGMPAARQMSILLPWLLAGAVLLTLLIACANVAILMIAQWTGREHEIAIRAALGAGRGRVMRTLLTESLVIAGTGGLLGIGATFGLVGWLAYRGGPETQMYDLSIDPVVFLQALSITVAAGVLAGIAPALYETRRLHSNPLRGLAASDRIRQRWRHTLVVAEIAVTVALLVVTAAMLDGYRRNMTANVGFRTRPLIVARIENVGGVPTGPIVDALQRMPGVAAAAAATAMPFATRGESQRVSVDASVPPIVAEEAWIVPGFFRALDLPIRAGRDFSARDSDATQTVIVSEALARRLFGARNAVGERVRIGATAGEIVGIAADYASNTLQPVGDAWRIYRPLSSGRSVRTRLPVLVRASGDAAPLVDAVRRAAHDAAPGTSVLSAYTVDDIIAVGGQEILVGTAPLLPLIATGIVLTAAGIYGVLAFAFARRAKELAVRIALGATTRDIVGLVAAHGVRLIVVGTIVGIGITFALTRVVRALGGAGSIFDPGWPAFVLPALLIAAIGAAATWAPLRRALHLDPAVLLRAD